MIWVAAPTSLAALVLAAQPSEAIEWTALGILAVVLMGVGKGMWTLIERADRRLEAADAQREKEREEDLQMQERMVTALLEAATGYKQATEVMSQINQGYKDVRASLDRLIERL